MQFHRRSIRLPDYDYSDFGYYFVTICTYDRECIFENLKFKTIVENLWQQTPKIRKNVKLDEFVVMPNHLHGIIIIENDNIVGAYCNTPLRINKSKFESPSQTLGAIIRGFKSATTKQINIIRHAPHFAVWQRNYYERIIRNNLELNRIRQYIINNPDNWEADRNNPKNFKITN